MKWKFGNPLYTIYRLSIVYTIIIIILLSILYIVDMLIFFQANHRDVSVLDLLSFTQFHHVSYQASAVHKVRCMPS